METLAHIWPVIHHDRHAGHAVVGIRQGADGDAIESRELDVGQQLGSAAGARTGSAQEDYLTGMVQDAACADEDPWPWTALGVFQAIRSAVRARFGTGSLSGVRVLVQGTGNVGASLAHQLAAADSHVDVSDIDLDRANAVADAIGGHVVQPSDVVGYECDVFAPCAVARVVPQQTLPQLACSIIAGGANDTLEDASCADGLAAAGILYVPDFVVNSGGVRFVHAQRSAWDREATTDFIEQIGVRVTEILDDAASSERTPLETAGLMARQLIDAKRSEIAAGGRQLRPSVAV
ncbi:Rossmann-fold NAD(P)-binding domain-containing protein [Arthrobacter sp. B2a2-09]|uniref:hypothetical protein n=1 Tax=Arthrobacter sp. B2a2-09 TaxID=2952822 RepID=UPI0022CD20AE|nr:hypothetical protein [Arthrobacter sp. B2a2-09]MCZ9883201.1 hypothetical protein [Arthrobacter sp. B2a2-09]